MSQNRFIPFEITSMDSLGQGVSKVTDKVTFIPKTAVGDAGSAEIMSEKRGVAFAKLKSLDKPSLDRIQPECVHFGSCPSCHYLHLSYEKELIYKKENFQRLFRKLQLPEVEVIGAPERFHYRNRIQLHYSVKSKLLGMKDPQTFAITPIPNCKIGLTPVLEELQRLYQNDQWMKEAPSHHKEGHVEIYWNKGVVKVNWNRPYAEGGFTQVYEVMNQKLKDVLSDQWKTSGDILDLFAGNGNLSDKLQYNKRLCVDMYQKLPGENFLNQNLYDNKALPQVLKVLKDRQMKPEHLLLDPPRSGLKDLSSWIEAISPRTVAYVSCDPHTIARDLESVKGYVYKNAFLIDFFPSTFHFETLIILERKS